MKESFEIILDCDCGLGYPHRKLRCDFQSLAKVSILFLVSSAHFTVFDSRNYNGTFSGAMTCLFFCTASATANLFGFFLTLAGAGCYGFAAYKHKTAVS